MEFTTTGDPRIEHQMELERKHDANQLVGRVRKEFAETPAIVQYLEENEVDMDFGLALLTQMAIHIRVMPTVLIGILRSHFPDCQACADEIMRCEGIGLLTWLPDDGATGRFKAEYTLTDELQKELNMFQYPLPMIVPPRPIRSNSDSGMYLLRNRSVVTNVETPAEDRDMCLDHLNRVNAVAFSINMRVSDMVSNRWKNLDKRKPGETTADFNKRRRRFADYDSVAKDVMNGLMHFENRMYLTHHYDFRGRFMPRGYHVNYQGTEWNKAVIELADKELVEGVDACRPSTLAA